ncbi:MAG: hypothetical protein P8R00_02930 [Candidatus Poseidoniaceae archaeon]|nr:hypothetical protein [Candidatus Poseidoniaceae archaeon]
MARDRTHSFDVNFIAKMNKRWLLNKPIRTSYLWANIVVLDDEDELCPIIEG